MGVLRVVCGCVAVSVSWFASERVSAFLPFTGSGAIDGFPCLGTL